MKILDPNSTGTPCESLPNVFRMLGLGTRSEIFQITVSTRKNWFSLQPNLEKKYTLLGFSLIGKWGQTTAEMEGPDKQEAEHQTLLATKSSRSRMSSLSPSNIKSLSSFH